MDLKIREFIRQKEWMKKNNPATNKQKLSILRWQISRIYRDLVPGVAGIPRQAGSYLEVTMNPPSRRNQFLSILNSSNLIQGVITKDHFKTIEHDALKYWLEEEKMGFIFENDLMDYIRETVAGLEPLDDRTIAEDMVFLLIGPRKSIRSLYKNINIDSIDNLEVLLKSSKTGGQHFQIVDITTQARKMASGIYRKALNKQEIQ